VAVQEVQTKIAQAQRNLPRDMDPPVIQKVNPEDQPILWVGVSGARPYTEISTYVRDHLLDRLQTIQGVNTHTMPCVHSANLARPRTRLNTLALVIPDRYTKNHSRP
jgi:multidrug efflux pump subunit AcrB